MKNLSSLFQWILLIFSSLLVGCQNTMPKEYVIDELHLVPEGIDYSESQDLTAANQLAERIISEIKALI